MRLTDQFEGQFMDRVIDAHQENERILLDLLKSVEHNGERSQRHIAGELGVALGLVNAYLKRCVHKGLVKVRDAPARRFAYYLTPQGFAEKSRLTVQYLSDSFSFFRLAKSDCASVFDLAKARGLSRLLLSGKSADVNVGFDGVIVTDLVDAKSSFDIAVAACGADHVFVPALLGLRTSNTTWDGAS
jgi:DNA-binding MarR family transcriptional regulator